MNIGDVVVLKSGGPNMTVRKVFQSANLTNMLECNWFSDRGESQHGVFPENSVSAHATSAISAPRVGILDFLDFDYKSLPVIHSTIHNFGECLKDQSRLVHFGHKIKMSPAAFHIGKHYNIDYSLVEEEGAELFSETLNCLYADNLLVGFMGKPLLIIDLATTTLAMESIIFSMCLIKGFDGTLHSLPQYARRFAMTEFGEPLT